MGKIYARFVLWLIRPAINMLSPLPRQVVEFRDAAIASKGDVLVLRATKSMGREQRIAVRELLDDMAKNAGIKIMMLEPGIELAQLIKFNDKGDYHP